MALAHGYALPFVTQKVVGDYASDNAAAAARAIASGATKEAAGSCLDARAINLQMRVPQRTDTNLLTNSAMAGATGSVLPTKWVSGSVNGLTVTISSAFTSAGFQAIDWTVSGTADSDGTIYIGCEPNNNTNAIPASVGQQYIGAMSLGKQAGTIPATMVMQVFGQKSSDGTVIETANSSTDLNGLVSGSLTRVNTAVLSIASVSSDRVNFRLTADVLQNDVISFTIRIAAPQVERNDRISPYITTTTGAASRVTGQPSLLIVPQLTRAGVVYPQLPVVSGADFTFTRATTATRVNASGLIESVASGVLRLDYPIGGGCPAALIEASGTNLALRSEEFNTATWFGLNLNAFGSGSVANSTGTTDPFGGTNADYIQENSASGTHLILQINAGQVSGTNLTFSVFAKAAERTRINLLNNGGGGGDATFNLSAGTATLNSGVFASIQNYGNGWYRCTLTYTPNLTGNFNVQVRLADASGNTSYTGTGTSGVYVFGAQVETGSFPTSYIPTTAAAATRNADVCSVSGVSGYIGQTEGTLYAEVQINNFTANSRILAISDGTSDARVILQEAANSVIQGIVTTASANVASISTASGQTAGTYKIALAYKADDFAMYVNGTQIGTDTGGAVPACSQIFLGKIETSATTNQLGDRLRAAAIYTTRLDNNTLANLTRLT